MRKFSREPVFVSERQDAVERATARRAILLAVMPKAKAALYDSFVSFLQTRTSRALRLDLSELTRLDPELSARMLEALRSFDGDSLDVSSIFTGESVEIRRGKIAFDEESSSMIGELCGWACAAAVPWEGDEAEARFRPVATLEKRLNALAGNSEWMRPPLENLWRTILGRVGEAVYDEGGGHGFFDAVAAAIGRESIHDLFLKQLLASARLDVDRFVRWRTRERIDPTLGIGELLANARLLHAVGHPEAALDLAASAYESQRTLLASYGDHPSRESLIATIRETIGARPFAVFGFPTVQEWVDRDAAGLEESRPMLDGPATGDALRKLQSWSRSRRPWAVN